MFLVSILLLIVVLYVYKTTRKHDYWKKRGIKYEKPIPFFGTTFSIVTGLTCIQDYCEKIYWKYPEEKVVGTHRGEKPELLIRDTEVIRQILNSDFAHFHKRGFGRNPKVEPLHVNIFSSEGDNWKLLRRKQTPVFTTAKLKSMFPLIVQCAEKLHNIGDNLVAQGKECDVRERMARFATEFIGVCGFGIDMDTMKDDNSHFRYIGKLITYPPLKSRIMLGIVEYFPELRNFVRVDPIEIDNAMVQLVETVRRQRNYKPIGRNDFIDLMLELECMGKIKGESMEKFKPDGKPMEAELEMDIKILAAQVFVFFVAGFETSSTTTSYTLHELAYHPEIQQRVQEEIDEVLSRYNNKLCYDAVAEMTYLEMAVKESLRKLPPVGALNRECAKKYTIPELNITLDPGTKILIPIQGLHYDEKYFDNPQEYRPERFSTEEIKFRDKYCYLPFGEGPRMCIGARLGQMQAMAGLATFLHRFSVEPGPSSRYDLIKDPTVNLVQGVKGGLPLKLKHKMNFKAC